jgi:predicted transcriptional regulator of viral defense system
MRFEKIKKEISDLLIFDKELLRNFESNENTLDENIKYWLKKGWLTSLKKGKYILTERFEKEKNKDLFLELIANKLVKPSYLSLEYVLSQYQLLAEPVQGLTSVTTKTSRVVNNDLAVFRYYSIAKNLFTGYEVKYFYDAPVLTAEKSKAIFDFVYLRFLQDVEPNEKTVKSLRIKWEEISKKTFFKAKKYSKNVSNPRILETFNIIEGIYYA